MIDAEKLKAKGIDYDKGLERFLNSTELYEEVLNAFYNDTVIDRIQKAYTEKDMNTLKAFVHEAKGSSGNADMTNVYEKAKDLLVMLRSENYSSEELQNTYNIFYEEYMSTKEAIKDALGK